MVCVDSILESVFYKNFKKIKKIKNVNDFFAKNKSFAITVDNSTFGLLYMRDITSR